MKKRILAIIGITCLFILGFPTVVVLFLTPYIWWNVIEVVPKAINLWVNIIFASLGCLLVFYAIYRLFEWLIKE